MWMVDANHCQGAGRPPFFFRLCSSDLAFAGRVKHFLEVRVRRKMVAMKAETMYLQPSQRLAGVQKEWHTHKRDGKDIAYVIFDRRSGVAKSPCSHRSCLQSRILSMLI